MPNSPREANAGMRTFAAITYQMFLALTQEGFTEKQALAVLGAFISAQIDKADDSNG